jgi:hypothetical protein
MADALIVTCKNPDLDADGVSEEDEAIAVSG